MKTKKIIKLKRLERRIVDMSVKYEEGSKMYLVCYNRLKEIDRLIRCLSKD